MRPGVNGINVVALCLVLFFFFLFATGSVADCCMFHSAGRTEVACYLYLYRYLSSGRGVAYCMCVGTLGLGSVHTPIVTVTVGVTPRVVQSSLVQLVIMEVVVEENDNEEDENGVKTEK